MDFYIVFVKSKKKLDKYIKINKIRNKAVIDIKQQLYDLGLEDDEYRSYFNLLIYTKITQTIKKNRDVYYIPNLDNIHTLDIDDVFQIRDHINKDVKINFNLLFFYEDFKDNKELNDNLISNISLFDAIQIIRDY